MASIRSGIGENMEDRYLFKAKDCNSIWRAGLLIALQEGRCAIEEKDGSKWACDSETLCQCTGLKDKNGNLIWENDIANFLGHKGVIKFESGSFGIGYRKNIDWEEIQANIMRITGCENLLYACENDNYISLWEIYWNFNDEDDSVNTVEVVGNIFDNPELLESE